MIIYKNGTRQLKPNYNEKEFFSNSPDAPDSHFLSDAAMEGAQIIRDAVGVAVTVNSTFRTVDHNESVGGGSNSQHLTGHAIDLDMAQSKLDELKKDIPRRGPIFNKLRAAGINGFGLYNGFIHIDSRPEGGKQIDPRGSFAFWDLSDDSQMADDEKKKP
jgi:hypothetical protein